MAAHTGNPNTWGWGLGGQGQATKQDVSTKRKTKKKKTHNPKCQLLRSDRMEAVPVTKGWLCESDL